jgi:hypothetical protein
MPKGKPWTVQEERQLTALRTEGKSVAEIALRMKLTPDAIKQKLRRLGLKVVTLEKSWGTTTSELILPEELPSVEEALKKLAAAMNALETPGLSKTEIMRLRSLIQATGAYQMRFAEYVNYRGLEKELVELTENYEELMKRMKLEEEAKDDQPFISGIQPKEEYASP